MIIQDYSQIKDSTPTPSIKEIAFAGAVVILPILFLLLISSR
jgi:hypothetical protein